MLFLWFMSRKNNVYREADNILLRQLYINNTTHNWYNLIFKNIILNFFKKNYNPAHRIQLLWAHLHQISSNLFMVYIVILTYYSYNLTCILAILIFAQKYSASEKKKNHLPISCSIERFLLLSLTFSIPNNPFS